MFLTWMLLGLTAYVSVLVAQRRFLSPLRHIPGPFIASITQLWLVTHDFAGTRTTAIHELHKKYGHTVRIGPNEVSFSDPAAVNQIYGVGQQYVFTKAPLYETMSLRPFGVFSLLDKKAHAERRSLLSPAFSNAHIKSTLPLIHGRIDTLVRVVEASKNKPIDMLLRFRLLALDIVGELFLGQSFGGLESETEPQFIKDADMWFINAAIRWQMPWLYQVLLLLPIASVRYFVDVGQRLSDFGNEKFQEYIATYGRKSTRRDLLTKFLTPADGREPLTDRETYLEISNMIFAGTGKVKSRRLADEDASDREPDTTSTTLTYLFWEIARNPEWQARVQEELGNNCSLQSLGERQLPVLEAVIEEALRVHPAVPGSLMRYAPDQSAVVAGYEIPPHTVVSMQCYTTQRDPLVFPDPDKFDPERWLSTDASPEAKTLYMPFSRGARSCLGKSLAMIELRLTVGALLSRYNVSAPAYTNEDCMTMRDHFLVMPKGGKCDLIFEPR